MSTMTDIDSVPGHNAYSEPAPRSSIYHPAYKIVTASIEEMVQLLREPLEESTYTDPNVEGLKSLLKRRSKARFPDEVRIALVGDMASGKSSLVNSLLSTGILARKVRRKYYSNGSWNAYTKLRAILEPAVPGSFRSSEKLCQIKPSHLEPRSNTTVRPSWEE